MGKKTLWIAVVCAFFLASCAGRAVQPSAGQARNFDGSVRQGTALMERGDYGRAAGEFRAALSFRQDSFRTHNLLGLCYLYQKEYDRAREEFVKSAALEPTFAKAYDNLAAVYSIKAQYDKAEQSYKKALELAPNMAAANYSLGILLTNLGRGEEGSVYISRGVALDPDFLEKNKDSTLTFSSQSFDAKEMYFACAKAYAAAGNLEKTVDYLNKARKSGFSEWRRILTEKEFEKVREEQKVKHFLKIEE
jgi:Tfp pilus assembly protein PilF